MLKEADFVIVGGGSAGLRWHLDTSKPSWVVDLATWSLRDVTIVLGVL